MCRYRDWFSQMPQSDDVNEYVQKFPLFVPFSKVLFAAPIVNIQASKSKISSAIDESELLLPSVSTTASVKWSGRIGEEAVNIISARVEIATGLPAPDARESAAAKKAAEKRNKRKQLQNAAEGVNAGDKCYINLQAWPEYREEWLYDSPIEKTFVQGIYGGIVSGKGRRQKRKLNVPVFNYEYNVDFDWITEWGVNFDVPEGGKSK